MKCCVFFILISCSCLFGMEKITIVPETVLMSSVPLRRMTWSAQLTDGQTVNASSCYVRKTRHAKPEDFLKVTYVGRIGRRRIYDDEAKVLIENLIKAQASISKRMI